MPEGRPARWNLVSVSMPFVGFLCGFFVGTGGEGILWHGHPMDGIFWGVSVWAAFCVLGLLAAGIAWARSERSWRVTALGFLLSAPLPVISGATATFNFVAKWMDYH